METLFPWMLDPLNAMTSMMARGQDISAKYQEFLKAQGKLFEAAAAYNRAALDLYTAAIHLPTDKKP
jgi:hypothetical protein